MLLPTLAATRTQDRSAVCMSNLRQIYAGMMMYATDYDDMFHHFGGGNTPNAGQWTANPNSTTLLPPTDASAYWGISYAIYVRTPRELFRCPSARIVDEWRDAGLNYPHEFWLTSTYGICQYLTKSYPGGTGPVKTSSFQNPGTMIVTQDSVEQRTEGGADNLGLFPGTSQILAQWKSGSSLSSLYGGYPFEWEYYRHERRCYTVWLSGRVSKIPFTGFTVGIDYRYYTGDKPLTPIPGS